MKSQALKSSIFYNNKNQKFEESNNNKTGVEKSIKTQKDKQNFDQRKKKLKQNLLQTSKKSLDSPIKKLQFSKQSSMGSEQLIDIIPAILKTAVKKNDKNEEINQQKQLNRKTRQWKFTDQNLQSNKKQQKKDQSKFSKIQLGQPEIKHLKVQKALSDDDIEFGNELQPIFKDQVSQKRQNLASLLDSHTLEQSSPQFQRKKPYLTILSSFREENDLNLNNNKKEEHLTPVKFRQNLKSPLIPPSPTQQKKARESKIDSLVSPLYQKYIQANKKYQRSLLSTKSSQLSQQPHLFHSESISRCHPHFKTTYVKQQLHLTLANNLTKILFKYNGGHSRSLCNNKLKIKNSSPVSVEVKILCTSPQHYNIRPTSERILKPGQVIDLFIQLKLYTRDLNPDTLRHNLGIYQNDKFKILYWAADFCPEVQYEEGQKILPVLIQDTEDEKIRSQGFLRNLTQEEEKIALGQKDILMYKKMIEEANVKIQILDQMKKKIEKKKFLTKHFNKDLVWVIAILGFLIGYFLG